MKKLSKIQIVASVITASFFMLSSSGGRDDSLTGHPLDGGSCANCHGGNSSEGSISLTGVPAAYFPGQVYPLTLILTDNDAVQAGFQIAAVSGPGSNTQVGNFQNIPSNTRITSSNRLTHSNPDDLSGGTVSWTFDWKAPTNSPPSGVTFYYAVNAVNGNGDISGDQVRTGLSVFIPLPVELLTFDAIHKSDHVEFNWSTAVEKNAESFEIQSSVDGITFETMDKKLAVGNSNKVQFYSSKVYNVAKTNYFRLKMIDFDGTFTYSKTVFIKSKSATPVVNVLSDMIEIYLPEEKSINLTLIDLSGKTILSETTPEINRWTMNTSNFPRGVYIVNINGSNIQRYVQKIVLQ